MNQPQLPTVAGLSVERETAGVAADADKKQFGEEVGKVGKAVALKYEKGREPAPRIVATGKGHVAEQIIQLAFASGVKVREDAALVEILSQLEVDSLIPLEAYAAVAEILNYVYRANSRAAEGYQPSGPAIRTEDQIEVQPPSREWDQE
jgi:flagellar biosynthesis protein